MGIWKRGTTAMSSNLLFIIFYAGRCYFLFLSSFPSESVFALVVFSPRVAFKNNLWEVYSNKIDFHGEWKWGQVILLLYLGSRYVINHLIWMKYMLV